MCTETETKLELKYFYPTVLEVADICVADQEIKIKMIAHSKECICPKCGIISVYPLKNTKKIINRDV